MEIPPASPGGIFLCSFARVGTGAHSIASSLAYTRGAEIAGLAKRPSAQAAQVICLRSRLSLPT